MEFMVFWVFVLCIGMVGYQHFLNHCTLWYSNPENHELYLHCLENIKSQIRNVWYEIWR